MYIKNRKDIKTCPAYTKKTDFNMVSYYQV